MVKFAKDIFTESNNETFDAGRFLWILGVVVFLFLSTVEVFKGHDFMPIEFGTGLSEVLAAGALAIRIKRKKH